MFSVRVFICSYSFRESRLTNGLKAYRTAHETSSCSAYHFAPLNTYHSLNPHPALSPFPEPGNAEACRTQARNETFYRQLLIQGALAVLLPTEDLQNACLRTLVSDIVADLILGQGVSGKACDGWFVHDACIKLVEMVKSGIETKRRSEETQRESRSRLERLGLLSPKGGDSPPYLSNKHQSHVSALFWRVLQYAYLFFLLARFAIVGLFRARSLPSRMNSPKWAPSPIAKKASSPSTPSPSWSAAPSPVQPPILEYRIFTLYSTLLDLSTRMPWLTGLSSLCKHGLLAGSGRLGTADSLLDK
jgi:PXA domain